MALKNILGGKGDKPAEKDAEVQKLREKFNNIVNTDANEKAETKPADAQPEQSNTSAQPTAPAAQAQPMTPASQYKMVDPEKAEENERITNLIMQQIKELIEIDNNLNAKNKELETKIGENASTLASTKSIVEQFNSRLELIEKNMEKFMGLYEVVTNRFNPFVEEGNIPLQQDVQTAKPAEKPAAPEEIEKKTHEIIEQTDLGTIAKEQEAIVEDELKKVVEIVGPQEAEKNKEELTKEISDLVKKEVQDAVTKHAKVNNEHLKTAMRDMLLESVKHIKESVQPSPAQSAPAQSVPAQTAHAETKPAATAPAEQKPAAEVQKPDEELHPDFHFSLPDGTPIKSIKGLQQAMETMDDESFKTHVNEDKNDFADWLHVVLHDDALAETVRQCKTKEDIQKAIAHL